MNISSFGDIIAFGNGNFDMKDMKIVNPRHKSSF